MFDFGFFSLMCGVGLGYGVGLEVTRTAAHRLCC